MELVVFRTLASPWNSNIHSNFRRQFVCVCVCTNVYELMLKAQIVRCVHAWPCFAFLHVALFSGCKNRIGVQIAKLQQCSSERKMLRLLRILYSGILGHFKLNYQYRQVSNKSILTNKESFDRILFLQILSRSPCLRLQACEIQAPTL